MTPSNSSQKDFEAGRQAVRPRFRRGHIHLAAGVTVLITIAAVLGITQKAEATRTAKAAGLSEEALAIPSSPVDPSPERSEDNGRTQTVIVQPGDSLAAIFGRVGLQPATVQAVLNAGPEARQLRVLRPGEQLEFDIRDGDLRALNYTIDRTRTLAVHSTGAGYQATLDVIVPETRSAQAQGTIVSSLYAAGLKSGLSDALIMQLAGIFGWDVDFALDIRAGDRFTVLYEEHFVGGKKLDDGVILAAEFINNGRVHRAIRFTDPSGHTDYYDADGRSMRKAFLRSPVDFRRISSKYQSERYHPVLGIKRPHRGVDYAAAIGTPIKAAGDGKVIFSGTKGGYGKTIILQHGGQISTLYAHLSRYGRGMKSGTRVRQGQTIGYLGKSGLATGPHLHYEFRVNGVHRNPLTVRLPSAEPIKAAYRGPFEHYVSAVMARLDLVSEVRLATAER